MALHVYKGSSPLAAQAVNSICKRIRVWLPASLGVPPLILRAITNGRSTHSAALFHTADLEFDERRR